jgi:hypothetical protein
VHDDDEHRDQHDEQGGADVAEDEAREGQAGALLAGLPDLPAGEMAADDRGDEAEPDDEPADPADKRRDGEHGYPMIWAPEHPRTGNGSYVFEHVLVMEEMLGRYLLPGENVHHRNGVRDDNRPENLELWVTPQPTGIRGVDALSWAREIIARYGEATFITQGN